LAEHIRPEYSFTNVKKKTFSDGFRITSWDGMRVLGDGTVDIRDDDLDVSVPEINRTLHFLLTLKLAIDNKSQFVGTGLQSEASL
jgi:hypothetical protein